MPRPLQHSLLFGAPANSLDCGFCSAFGMLRFYYNALNLSETKNGNVPTRGAHCRFAYYMRFCMLALLLMPW